LKFHPKILNISADSWKQNPEALLKKAYRDNSDWCKRYVCNNNGSEADASDLFQESISVAWLNLKEGKFQGNQEDFNAYIRQICKNKWINQLRLNAKNPVILKENLSIIEAAIEPELIEKETDLIRLLKDSFSALGDKCRDLLSRFYFGKQSLAELSQLMGTTEESMKTIKYRCMMRLRKAYLERSKEDE
jgi:RNA polymerase sigma factor (sigma-70 family)